MNTYYATLTPEALAALYHEQSEEDLQIIGELYERYKKAVYKWCLGYLYKQWGKKAYDYEGLEDIVSDIFIKLVAALKKHRIQKNFTAWFKRFSLNFLINTIKKESRVSIQSIIEEKDANQFMENVDLDCLLDYKAYNFELKELNLHQTLQSFEIDETILINTTLSLLIEPQEICMRLFFLESKRYKEIAETTKYSLKEVKSHLQNGKRNLRKILTKVLEQHLTDKKKGGFWDS